jgi:hypothetical protein
MQCLGCFHLNRDTAKFCIGCGKLLPTVAPSPSLTPSSDAVGVIPLGHQPTVHLGFSDSPDANAASLTPTPSNSATPPPPMLGAQPTVPTTPTSSPTTTAPTPPTSPTPPRPKARTAPRGTPKTSTTYPTPGSTLADGAGVGLLIGGSLLSGAWRSSWATWLHYAVRNVGWVFSNFVYSMAMLLSLAVAVVFLGAGAWLVSQRPPKPAIALAAAIAAATGAVLVTFSLVFTWDADALWELSDSYGRASVPLRLFGGLLASGAAFTIAAKTTNPAVFTNLKWPTFPTPNSVPAPSTGLTGSTGAQATPASPPAPTNAAQPPVDPLQSNATGGPLA